MDELTLMFESLTISQTASAKSCLPQDNTSGAMMSPGEKLGKHVNTGIWKYPIMDEGIMDIDLIV